MKDEGGYVLFFCLMLLGLLSLLTLSELRSLYIYSKTVAVRTQRHHQDYQLEHQARLLVRQPLKRIPRSCMGSERELDDLIRQLSSGQLGCPLENGRFIYWIEALNSDDCLQIKSKDKIYASHHFRYTLILKEERSAKSMLQIHVMKRGRPAHCIHKAYRLAPGVSSWRLISF